MSQHQHAWHDSDPSKVQPGRMRHGNSSYLHDTLRTKAVPKQEAAHSGVHCTQRINQQHHVSPRVCCPGQSKPRLLAPCNTCSHTSAQRNYKFRIKMAVTCGLG